MCFTQLKQNRFFNFHNKLFACVLFALIPLVIDSFFYRLMSTTGYIWKDSSFYNRIDVTIPLDYNIPIQPWVVIFYSSSVVSWVLIPLFIGLVFDMDKLAKLISISFVTQLVGGILGASLYINCDDITHYHYDTITGTGWLDNITKYVLKACWSGFGSFPSFHCVNITYMLYAIIDFTYFDKSKIEGNSLLGLFKKEQTNKYIKFVLTVIFGVYSALAFCGTFLLHVHFFVDWIPSLIIVTIVYFLMAKYDNKNKIKKWVLEIMINYSYSLWYVDESYFKSFNVKQYEWTKVHNNTARLNSCDKKKYGILKHFLIADIYHAVLVTIYSFMLTFVVAGLNRDVWYFHLLIMLLLTAVVLLCVLLYFIYHRCFILYLQKQEVSIKKAT